MIQFNQIYEKTIEAYQKGEIYELLTGKKGYKLPVLDAPVDVPTDWNRIIEKGIYPLYKKEGAEVKKAFEDGIKRAMDGNVWDVWSVMYILFFQAAEERKKEAPFVIDKNIFRDYEDAVKRKRAEMEKIYPYGKNGYNMFQDIMRLNIIYYEDYKAVIIKMPDAYKRFLR